MIWAALMSAKSVLSRVPWQVWVALAIVLSAWLWGNHRYSQGVADEKARWEALVAKAEKKAAKADTDAGKAVSETKSEVERKNDEARKSADGSDDPLKAGLDTLR